MIKKGSLKFIGYGLIGILFLILLILAKPSDAKALQWYENLISDSEFTASSSMTAQQIQNFLVSKGSGLANYTIPEGRIPADGYASTQPGAGQKASDFIYWAAQNFGINPKAILVTMEKEESLITLSNPNSVRLEWAMGYGYYAGSPYIDPNNADYVGGFGRQVYWATAFYKNRMDNVGGLQGPGNSHIGDTINVQTYSWLSGTTSVFLSTRATALLYRYTPFIHNGNYNFYTLYRNWFGAGSNWSFLLIKSSTDVEQKVYLVDKGKKIYIPYIEVFNHWGFRDSQIAVMSQTAVDSYPTADFNLSLLARGDYEPYVYVINNGYKRYITTSRVYNITQEIVGSFGGNLVFLSQEMINMITTGVEYTPFVKNGSGSYWVAYGDYKYPITTQMMPAWGLSVDIANLISDANLNALGDGPNLPDLVVPYGYSCVWKIASGTRSWIPDPATLYVLYPSQGVTRIPLAILFLVPRTTDASILVKGSGPEIYLTGNGYKRWIPDINTFFLLGLDLSNVKIVPDYILDGVVRGWPRFYLVKGSSSNVYLVYNGYKRLIPHPDVVTNWGFRWEDIVTVNDTWLNNYPMWLPVQSLVKGYNDSSIYYLDGAYKRYIPSVDRFNAYGFSWLDILGVDQYLINFYPTGPGM